MTLEQLLEWWPVIVFLLNAGALWVMWSMRQQFVPRREFHALVERVQTIEATMTNLATKEDIGKVMLLLERSDGERKALQSKVDGINAQLERIATPLTIIQEHLLAQGRAAR